MLDEVGELRREGRVLRPDADAEAAALVLTRKLRSAGLSVILDGSGAAFGSDARGGAVSSAFTASRSLTTASVWVMRLEKTQLGRPPQRGPTD